MGKRLVLMGAAEIQARLRISRQRAYQLVTRKDFPDPYQVLAMGSVWDRDDVEAWIKKHRPHLDDPDEA
jgi:predicted DNA-binding transcriptional regulator AlpA